MGSKNVPNPLDGIKAIARYNFGEKTDSLYHVRGMKPVFAFDYISIEETAYCFNSEAIENKTDFHGFFKGIKRISSVTYDDMTKTDQFHFHSINFEDTNYSLSLTKNDFLKYLGKKNQRGEIDQLPTFYQFKIFEEARLVGFIYKAVFYPVLLDRNHKVYKRR